MRLVSCQLLWHVTVASLQQELIIAHELRDDKLVELRRQAEDRAAAQQTAFDQKVNRYFWVVH